MRSLNNLTSEHSFNSFPLNPRSFSFLSWMVQGEKKRLTPLVKESLHKVNFLLIISSTKIETKHLDTMVSIN